MGYIVVSEANFISVKKFLDFMEPECPLPFSQQPSILLSTEQDESTPWPPIVIH